MIDLLGMEHSRHLAEHACSLEIRMASIEKNFKLKVFSERTVAAPKPWTRAWQRWKTGEPGNATSRTKAPAKAAIAGWKA
jgi:hypothetical protein